MANLIFSVAVCFAAAQTPIHKAEVIFPHDPKHSHGSSIVEAPNGDLLTCWFHGSGERSADDVLVQGARLKKGSTTWSPVFVMADTPGFPDCNPVLFIDPQKKLWLFWITVQANKWEDSLLKYRTATDYSGEGAPKWNWQDVINLKPGEEFIAAIKQGFKELAPEESLWAEYAPQYTKMILTAAQDPLKRQLGWMTRIHPLALPGGRMLLPLYSDGFNVSLAAISDDAGATWRASKPMVGLGPIQPTLVRKRDGSINSYMRDSGGPPERVMLSTSQDNGDSWTPARDTDIPNPGSSLEVIALKNGNWAMIFNDTENGRHSLAMALSDDEGATWKWKRHLENFAKGEGSGAYPSIIQAKDSMLHCTYSFNTKAVPGATIKHACFNEEWIRAGD